LPQLLCWVYSAGWILTGTRPSFLFVPIMKKLAVVSALWCKWPILRRVLATCKHRIQSNIVQAVQRSMWFLLIMRMRLHPNYANKHDKKTIALQFIKGAVIKVNANHVMQTNSETASVIREIAAEARIMTCSALLFAVRWRAW